MISRRKQFLPVIGLILLAGFFITSFASYFASRSSLDLRINGRELLENYQQRNQTHITLTDKEGLILSDSDPRHQAGADIHTVPGLSSVAKEILSSTNTKTVTFTRDRLSVHLSSQFIPALNGYLLVEQGARPDTGRITKTLVINLLFGIFITLLILTLIHSTINRYKGKLLNMGDDDDKIRRINLRQKIEISRQNRVLLRQNTKLQDALTEVKQLSGFLPICASCKKIRDDQGYWSQIETYISARSEAVFSHSICPKCAKRLYPELYPT